MPAILDAVYGCLIGGAIGDALGAPVEMWHFREIRAKYGRVTELMPFEKSYCGGPGGTVTDDSTLRHYLCLAIVERGGRVNPDDVAQIWLSRLNPERLWVNEHIVLEKLRIGMSPWDTGKGQPPCGCASMAIAPIGLINAGDPRQAYQDAFNIAFVNQDDVNRDAAASIAAGIAVALLPGATVERVIDTMVEYSSFVMRRAYELAMDLARASSSVDEFAERYYERMLDWTWPHPPSRSAWNKERFASGNSIEFVPVVPALLHLTGGDVHEAIIEGASFGRDCDTIASILGNLVGAMHGASAIRPDWIAACEQANRPFFEEVDGDPDANFLHMARRLVEAVRSEHQAALDRARTLEQIIS